MFGMLTYDDCDKLVPAKKPTTLLTNMPAVASYLSRRGDGKHEHWALEGHARGRGRRTTMAPVYPLGFIDAVLKATKTHMEWDSRGLYLLNAVEKEDEGWPAPTVPEEEDTLEFAMSWDDLTG